MSWIDTDLPGHPHACTVSPSVSIQISQNFRIIDWMHG